VCSHDGQRTQSRDGVNLTFEDATPLRGPATRVSWWIRDGPCTREGADLVPGHISREWAEQLLDKATARVGADVNTLPSFCRSYYSSDDPEDWGIKEVEPECP